MAQDKYAKYVFEGLKTISRFTTPQWEGKSLFSFHWSEEAGVALKFNSADVLPEVISALDDYKGRQISVGIRPQRLVMGPPAESGRPGVVNGKLLVHEFLGKEGITQVEVDSQTLECVTQPDIPFSEDDPVGITFSLEDMHFFDPETTKRIME